jgi:hypothetical protein
LPSRGCPVDGNIDTRGQLGWRIENDLSFAFAFAFAFALTLSFPFTLAFSFALAFSDGDGAADAGEADLVVGAVGVVGAGVGQRRLTGRDDDSDGGCEQRSARTVYHGFSLWGFRVRSARDAQPGGRTG